MALERFLTNTSGGGRGRGLRHAIESGVASVKEASGNIAGAARERAADRLRRELEASIGLDECEREDLAKTRLDAFLRRSDLDAERLRDDTVARLRERLAPPANRSLDELVDAALDAGGEPGVRPDGEKEGRRPNSGPNPTSNAMEALEQLCAEAGVETDGSLIETLDALLDADAAVVGHAAESVADDRNLLDGDILDSDDGRLPRFPSPLGDGVDEAAGRFSDFHTDSPDDATVNVRARTTGADTRTGPPPAGPQRGVSVRTIAALVVAAVAGFGSSTSASELAGGWSEAAGVGDLDIGELSVDGWGLLEQCATAARLLSDGDNSPAATDTTGAENGGRRRTVARALAVLFVVNLVAMSVGAYLSRKHAPPIPEAVVGPDGERIVTASSITAGKQTFQANGLMNHGSILGNGAYYGSDLTADALRRKTDHMRDYYARERGADSFDALDEDDRAAVARRVERELNAEADDTETVRYSAAEAYAHRRIRETYVDRYHHGDRGRGIPAGTVPDERAAEQLADFACWTAWFAHTNRPGSSHSYTNDWPYVPGSGNRPTDQVLGWSAASLILLVAGAGVGVVAYRRLDFAEPTTEAVEVPTPDAVSVTPAQHTASWYVPVAGALFTAQTLLGALLAHYYVERDGFFGAGDALEVDVLDILPFSVVRTWHINLAILWVTTLWLAGGLFLPGLFSEEDPPGQARGAAVLLVALVATTVGAFAGIWLGTAGKLGSPDDGERWWLLGTEGLEYLEAGRVWKGILLGAFVGWAGLAYRGVRGIDDRPTGIGHLMLYAGGSIALLFGASMLYTPETNLAVTEFWRWWVVHMWVEGVFEFFVTAVTAVALVSMGLLEKGAAEKAVLFETFAIMGAGIVGVSHHYWWIGLPDWWVPIGTTFSTLEFVPLLFVLYRSLEEYRTLDAQDASFPYSLPLLFILGSSIWNFVGAGVLGFFINVPVINYFEHGTYLTVAHGHAATFGAFGLLALGLGTYILRVVTPESAWEPGWFRGAFWLSNLGLTLMTAGSLIPLGFRQLRAVYEEGYATARSPAFYDRPTNRRLLWARSLGDVPMILGALAFTVGAVRLLLRARAERESTVSLR